MGLVERKGDADRAPNEAISAFQAVIAGGLLSWIRKPKYLDIRISDIVHHHHPRVKAKCRHRKNDFRIHLGSAPHTVELNGSGSD